MGGKRPETFARSRTQSETTGADETRQRRPPRYRDDRFEGASGSDRQRALVGSHQEPRRANARCGSLGRTGRLCRSWGEMNLRRIGEQTPAFPRMQNRRAPARSDSLPTTSETPLTVEAETRSARIGELCLVRRQAAACVRRSRRVCLERRRSRGGPPCSSLFSHCVCSRSRIAERKRAALCAPEQVPRRKPCQKTSSWVGWVRYASRLRSYSRVVSAEA
jgi:hypothetical protein